MKLIKEIITVSIAVASALCASAQKVEVGKPLPAWTDGYLDIHAVNTGRGECTFMIFPDGTTMLVDAGESKGKSPNLVDPKPNAETAPYETYTKYIKHFLEGTGNKELDYMLLTHFHMDHMGDIYDGMPESKTGAYKLTGLAGVGETIPFRKVIDRAWPDYKLPIEPVSLAFPNYLNFIKWHKANNGTEIERFNVGKNDQIILTHNPGKYPEFEVRNIAANGVVWTGVADVTRDHFIPTKYLPNKSDWPDENECSIAFRVSYGPFDYFTGGDLPSVTTHDWQNIELPVGAVAGPVEAMKSNHHMNYDAMGVDILKGLRPQVVVVHNAKAQQPDIEVLRRIQSKVKAYPGKIKDVYSTNFHKATKYVAYPNTAKMPAKEGHIVIRVVPGGKEFYVYSLDDTNDSYTVKTVNGPYLCN